MKVHRILVAAALLVGIAGTGLVLAQNRPDRRRPRSPEEAREIRETMLALMSLKMKQNLELTEDQERDIMPLLEELQNLRVEARSEMMKNMGELRRLVDDPGSSDRDIREALDRIRDGRRTMEDRQRNVRQEIDRHLSIRQQAKMLFFEARFRHDMERRIRGLDGWGRRGYGDDRRSEEPPGDVEPDEPF